MVPARGLTFGFAWKLYISKALPTPLGGPTVNQGAPELAVHGASAGVVANETVRELAASPGTVTDPSLSREVPPSIRNRVCAMLVSANRGTGADRLATLVTLTGATPICTKAVPTDGFVAELET